MWQLMSDYKQVLYVPFYYHLLIIDLPESNINYTMLLLSLVYLIILWSWSCWMHARQVT